MPSAASRDELPPGLALHPQLGEHGDQPGLPRADPLGLAGEQPDRRRQLGQPPLLAADAEHLDPVGAGSVPAAHQPTPLFRALRLRLGFGQAAVAEGDRRAVVRGDVMHEGLRRALGHLLQDDDLGARRLEVAESDEGRHAPGHRLGAKFFVAQLLGQIPRLGQHRQDLLERAGPARPVRADQHPGQPGAIAAATRQRDRIAADDRSALALALKIERAGEAGEQADAQLVIAIAQGADALLEQLDRVLDPDPRAPAGIPIADRSAGEQLGAAELAGERRGRGECLQGLRRLARAVADRAQLEEDLGADGRIVHPHLDRRAQARGGLVESQRGGGGASGTKVVLDRTLGCRRRQPPRRSGGRGRPEHGRSLRRRLRGPRRRAGAARLAAPARARRRAPAAPARG